MSSSFGLAAKDVVVGGCRKRKRITKRNDDEDSGSEFSLSDEAAPDNGSDRAPSDNSAEFETDSELSDDPLGEYDDADDDLYEQRRHKYTRGQHCHTRVIMHTPLHFLLIL